MLIQLMYFSAEMDLWRIMKFYELKANFRQTGPDPLRTICSKLRVGKLELSDVELLYKRLLQKSNPEYSKLTDNFKNCVWVFPKIRQVNTFNAEKTEELRKSGVTIYKWRAKDTYVEGLHHDIEVPPNMVYKDENKCGGLCTELELGIGSRVMLRRNKNVRHGLVNGAMGTVMGFEWAFGHQQIKDVSFPTAVIVKFDHRDEPVKIEAESATFLGKRQKQVTRRQIPLLVAFAVNIHKMQGDTVEKMVLDLSKNLFAKAMAYVGISRVKSMDGLGIIAIDPTKLYTTNRYCPCDMDALAELDRLRGLTNAISE